jgi:Protein of unknown function DUF115
MINSFYKLDLFDQVPKNYNGTLFSFEGALGTTQIDISDDPFLSVKKAVLTALGSPCGLVIEGSSFFSELFCSLYEQLGLVYLETKDYFLKHTQAFLAKLPLHFSLIEFSDYKDVPVIVVGKGVSLNEDIQALKQIQDHVFVVSAYSALEMLDQHGIKVDLAFACDPMQKMHNSKNAKHLVISAKTNPSICEGFESLCFFPESHCQFSNFLFSKTPHAPVYGYTIIDTAIKYLTQQGFKSFYLTGVDLEEEGGMYCDNTPCGFKPDFKKAKDHLSSLKGSDISILSFKGSNLGALNFLKPKVELKDFESKSMIDHFSKSLSELKNLDFKSLGLYEMFLLEQNPFYQVVLEPLYEKKILLDGMQTLDKRDYFAYVLQKYQTLGSHL